MQGVGGLEALVNETTGEVESTLTDAFGNVIGFVFETQGCEGKTVIHQNSFDHWGASSNRKISWRGKTEDPNGLYYLGARYYNPQTVTFISPDSLSFAAGMNLYAYAHGADNIWTGMKSSYTGHQQAANLNQAFQEAGFSSQTSSYLNMGVDFFSTLGA